MRSIERRFNKISKKYPEWSSYVRFITAIRDQNFTKRSIYAWFSRLVDEDDFAREDKMKILRQLPDSKPP